MFSKSFNSFLGGFLSLFLGEEQNGQESDGAHKCIFIEMFHMAWEIQDRLRDKTHKRNHERLGSVNDKSPSEW